MRLVPSVPLAALPFAFGVMTLSERALSDDATAECLSAHESAQLARAAGDLLATRTHLLSCLRPACPSIVQKDCGGWLEEIDRDLPTVVVLVRQDDVDRDDAELSIDERPTPLGGREIPLNPGRHVFRARLPSGEVKEQTVLIAVGERGRRVVLEWKTPAPAVEPPGRRGEVSPAEPRLSRPIPSTVWISLGVAGAGFATGAALGSLGLVEKDSLTCAPFCSSAQKGSVDDKFVAADVAFGVGAVGLLAAATFYWFRPEVPEAQVSVRFDAHPGGGALFVDGRF